MSKTIERLETIYKLDSKGKLRVWTAEIEGDKWRVESGLESGKKTTTKWTTCTPKSQDTAEAQARFEANAARTNKLKREYVETAEAARGGASTMFKPMLADRHDKVDIDWSRPVLIQPKLDGQRCIIKKDGAFTRQNGRIHAIPFIEKCLAPLFEKNPDMVLDGELYSHHIRTEYGFEKLMSCTRPETFTEEEMEFNRQHLQFWIFDSYMPNDDSHYPGRIRRAMREVMAMQRDPEEHMPISFVTTKQITKPEQGDEFHEIALKQGHEGTIYRLPGPYENKRSKTLLKRKPKDTAEATITGIEEGKGQWSGMAKGVLLEIPEAGLKFKAGMRGDEAFARSVLENSSDYVGTEVTIEFEGYTGANRVPRFPVVIDWHKGKRKD